MLPSFIAKRPWLATLTVSALNPIQWSIDPEDGDRLISEMSEKRTCKKIRETIQVVDHSATSDEALQRWCIVIICKNSSSYSSILEFYPFISISSSTSKKKST